MSSASLDTIASRYALALFEIAKDQKGEQRYLKNLVDFSKLLADSRDLSLALSHPNVKNGEKQSILTWIIQNSQFEPMFQNFVRLLVDRSKISLIPRIASQYGKFLDQAQNRERAIVTSAQALSASQREALKARIAAQRGCEIELEERVDAAVLGGLRVQIAGRIFDSTISRHLERIKDELTKSQ